MTAAAMFMLGMSVGMFIFHGMQILDKHAERKERQRKRQREAELLVPEDY